jgi:hypothetical protein
MLTPYNRSVDQTLVETSGHASQGWDGNIMVDEDLLCRYYKPLYKKLKESDGHKMKLPSASKTTLELFKHWLYAQATTKGEQALEPTKALLDNDQSQCSYHSPPRDKILSTPAWLNGIGKSHYETWISLAKQHRRRETPLAVKQNLS